MWVMADDGELVNLAHAEVITYTLDDEYEGEPGTEYFEVQALFRNASHNLASALLEEEAEGLVRDIFKRLSSGKKFMDLNDYVPDAAKERSKV